jgi:hypothetical protein
MSRVACHETFVTFAQLFPRLRRSCLSHG